MTTQIPEDPLSVADDNYSRNFGAEEGNLVAVWLQFGLSLVAIWVLIGRSSAVASGPTSSRVSCACKTPNPEEMLKV